MQWVQRELQRRQAEQQQLSTDAGSVIRPLRFEALGSAGLLLKVRCNQPAWISFYVSQAAMDGDAGRPQGLDPLAEAGVVCDLAFQSGVLELLLPPGVSWANQDEPLAAVLHGRMRTVLASPATVSLAVEALVLSS
jgi:hypothetical protein